MRGQKDFFADLPMARLEMLCNYKMGYLASKRKRIDPGREDRRVARLCRSVA